MVLAREHAENIGLRAVVWLASNDELLPVFMGATGAGRDELAALIADPAFHGAVLDFLMQDDAWVLEFCAAENIPPDRIMAARAQLPGGEQVHWT